MMPIVMRQSGEGEAMQMKVAEAVKVSLENGISRITKRLKAVLITNRRCDLMTAR